jgi:SAM-dependent methyltransferase
VLVLSKLPLPLDLAAKIRRVSNKGRKRLGDRLHRLLDHAYYRHVFGLTVPGAPNLTRKLAGLERRQGRGDVPVPPDTWESQYRDGRWVYLNGLQQMTRYSVIAGYLQALKKGGFMLDVGCGEGILLDRLGAPNYEQFVGIDWSHVAIEQAQRKQHPRSVFVQADAQHFVPEDTFDAIIFNEVLYYFDEPLAVAQRYHAWLRPGGLFITSLFASSDRSRAIGRLLKQAYDCVDEVEITGHGRSWIIDVLAPFATSAKCLSAGDSYHGR